MTGDHGEARGEHGELTHGLFGYEATLHVPLFSGAPTCPRRAATTTPARHVDILPTILDAVGDRAAQELPGQSLLPRTAQEPPEASTSRPSRRRSTAAGRRCGA